MDKPVLEILEGELFGRGADVAFFVPIGLDVSMERSDQDVAPYIKLSLVVEERHKISLDNMRPFTIAIRILLTLQYYLFYLLDVLSHLDSASLVRILPRLYDPQILLFLLLHDLAFSLGRQGTLLLVKILKESSPLIVPLDLYVKGEGNVLEGVLFGDLIEFFEVVIKCFFIGDVPIELEMIMYSKFISGLIKVVGLI